MMTFPELTSLLDSAHRRWQLVGTPKRGIVIALDVEGRLFTIQDNLVLSRVNPEAIRGISTASQYLNPGGDGLWPAPEGSRCGFEYSTGTWRVPPSITSARWLPCDEAKPDHAKFCAEIDLINASSLGLPCRFSRDISVSGDAQDMTVTTTESIQYLGRLTLSRPDTLLVPWSLCQFDCDQDCFLTIPNCCPEQLRDLYAPSTAKQSWSDNGCELALATTERLQIALTPEVMGLVFHNHRTGLSVQRTALLAENGVEIDIADTPPDTAPIGPPIRFSAYSDPSGFMEIEAAGAMPDKVEPGQSLSLTVITRYCRQNA